MMGIAMRRPRWRTRDLCDLPVSRVDPRLFRAELLKRGAIMIRGAADARVLAAIRAELDAAFAELAVIPPEEFVRRAQGDDPVERDYWTQTRWGHIYDRHFKKRTGGALSFFDALDRARLREVAAAAFPECAFEESIVTNCKRIDPRESDRHLWGFPVAFHVDAQYHDHEVFALNFWTPITACGRDAPGLQVALAPVETTKDYLGYDPESRTMRAGDVANTHKFDLGAMDEGAIVARFGAGSLFAPEFAPGDVLVFTNFTLHRTYVHPGMDRPRLSLELRIDGTPRRPRPA